METEYEKALMALDMFCRAAEKATGDYWDVQSLYNGDLAVVQTFKSAKETLDDPKISDEEKKLMITGTLFCTSSGSLADLAERLVLMSSRRSPGFVSPPWPLPFLNGCASVEEMMVRLAAYG